MLFYDQKQVKLRTEHFFIIQKISQPPPKLKRGVILKASFYAIPVSPYDIDIKDDMNYTVSKNTF